MKTLAELMNLCGRTALVTGACGGIGQTICRSLCELGCDIVLLDRDPQRLDQQAEQLQKQYKTRVVGVCADLEHENQRELVLEQVLQHFSGLDILVNNAAFVGASELTGWAVPLAEQTICTWRRAVEVNLTACFHLSQILAPMIAKRENGSIVNIGSIYGVVGPDMGLYEGTSMGNPAAYAVSKGGMVQLTRWMSTTLAPEIRVNCISPGGVYRGQPEAFVERYVARTPLNRMATEEDFMGAIAYLASDLSRYVTGQNLMVDGGWTAW
jgi:NAD(P)-dependent dehydrogenase (short-subunit alcohol dehydrogenase family)